MPTRAILLSVTRDARMSATILCLCLSNVANACVNHRPRVIHLDIGANNGEASRDFALQHAAERPQLFAFEPNPRFVKHLALLHKHLNLTHVRAAAWVADTILDFQFSSWDEGSSLVAAQSAFGDGRAWKSSNGGCRNESESDVEASQLADDVRHIRRASGRAIICDKPRVDKVRAVDLARWMRQTLCASKTRGDSIFAKMDIEGAEYTVLDHLVRDGVICELKTLLLEWHKVKAVNRSLVSANRIELVKQLSACGVLVREVHPEAFGEGALHRPSRGGQAARQFSAAAEVAAEKKKGSSFFQFAKDLLGWGSRG